VISTRNWPASRLLSSTSAERSVALGTQLLARAGITIDGDKPWDIQIKNPEFLARVFRDGTLAFGKSYMDGWWESEQLDETIARILGARLDEAIRESWVMLAHVVRARLVNLQAVSRAFEVGEKHYDIGNDLYSRMLDDRMVYTCGYWKDAADIHQAQENKLDLVCRKIGLEKGMRVLELGCGWGSFARFAAERYGAEVTGYTVSKEQAELARERCEGLPVDIRLSDYRAAQGTYDRVISIGIMEHVGAKNYRTYMEVANRCLVDDGIAFVHTIASNVTRKTLDPWFHKYIFPNAHLPTIAQLGAAMEGLFVLEDLHNIGEHYDKTLMAWNERFEASWDEIKSAYDERFRRMWRFYLLSCAGGFRARFTQLYQIVMTKMGRTQPATARSI
jgi:cyclopropane-fatty-acyl-phospholipid synthase